MTSRRHFIKRSLISGALLYRAPGSLFTGGTEDDGNDAGGFLRLSLDPSRPAFSAFSVDGLGKGQFGGNVLLAPSSAAVLGSVTPAPAATYASRPKKKGMAYFIAGNQHTPVWTIQYGEKRISLESRYVDESAQPEPFLISVAQQLNHSTALGQMAGDSQLQFPCLFHLPGMGTFRLHCNQADVTLLYDAYRFHGKSEKGDPFVSIGFKPADKTHPSITYTMEVVTIYPAIDAIRGNEQFDGVRRNFINIFQLNPRIKVLANNSASDACAFTLYLYAEMARRTPMLAEGLTAMDLIRSTLDVYLGGMKGYGQVGYKQSYGWASAYDSSDSAPSLIMSACYYILDTHDWNWARTHYEGIREWAQKMILTDTNLDGIIEYGYSGNTGSWNEGAFKRPANWWDTIGFGHDDAYSNALAYRSCTLLAEVAAQLGKTADSTAFSTFATKLKAQYFQHFYNPETGVLAGWRSADGALHDYYFTFVNGVAITYGLLTKEQGEQVMSKMLQKMREVGYTNFGLGLPGNLVPIPPGDYTHHLQRWGYGAKPDGSDGFQIYENGGATACYAYFTIKALYDLNMRKEADTIFIPMLESFKNGGFEGQCEHSTYTKDWKTWSGECWGYEGFLVDNYLTLLAIFDQQSIH